MYSQNHHRSQFQVLVFLNSVLLTWALGLSLAQDLWCLGRTDLNVVLPEGWGDTYPPGAMWHYLRTAPRSISHLAPLACPTLSQRKPPGREAQMLEREAIGTREMETIKGIWQNTNRIRYNELRKKGSEFSWMLIICSSASLGFPGFEGSQVTFSFCLWFPSETIIALGKCIHVKNHFSPCLSL